MGNMEVQRVLAVAAEQLASRPALLNKMQHDLASGHLWCCNDADCMVRTMVALENDGLIQHSFVESHLRGFINEWAASQEEQVIQLYTRQQAANDGAVPAAETPLSRAALIGKLASRWPSIEDDLRHCYMNGLSAAKAGQYDWLESAALRWASLHGRLPQVADDQSAAAAPASC